MGEPENFGVEGGVGVTFNSRAVATVTVVFPKVRRCHGVSMTTRASHSLSPAPWQGKLGLGLGEHSGSLDEGSRPLVAEAPSCYFPSQPRFP